MRVRNERFGVFVFRKDRPWPQSKFACVGHSVPASSEGEALHKAKRYFDKQKKKNPDYCGDATHDDVRVLDMAEYVTGNYEIDSTCKLPENASTHIEGGTSK